MKKTMGIAAVILALMLLVACGGDKASSSAPGAVSKAGSAAGGGLTMQEVAKDNGENGNPAYVVVDGMVYNVTDVSEWAGGKHHGHTAGTDMTDAIKNESPHGLSVLKEIPEVGKLEG